MNLSLATDHLVSLIWLYLIIGLVSLTIRHFSVLRQYLKVRKASALKPAAKDFSLIFLGLFLLIGSFGIVSALISIMAVDSFTNNTAQGTLKMWKDFVPAGASATVIGLMLAGISLMMSGGYRWLVTLAKILITLAAINFIVFMMVAAA